MPKKYYFFLGGQDAEMNQIHIILTENGIPFSDKFLAWGAKASAYAEDFAGVVSRGFTPVIVELEIDCPVPDGTIEIDHHGSRSDNPASILQVLSLLNIEPTRWDQIVAANDSGWFPGLQALSATSEEMTSIRREERLTAGITAQMEVEAARALSAPVEIVGGVRIIRMTHSKTAPIGDAIAIEAIAAGKPIPDYLVLSEGEEVNFSGRGDIAQALYQKFPGGWAGGQGLGNSQGTAYWGGYPPHQAVLDFLENI